MAMIWMGCGKTNRISDLEKADNLIVDEKYDSAYRVVCHVDKSSLTTQEEIAHYELLLTQTRYLTDHPAPADSVIDEAIKYYEESGNKERLAECYYYKAALLSEKGDDKQAIVWLKKAEQQAKHTDNLRLQYKIASFFATINDFNDNYHLQMKYAEEAIRIAKKAANKKWMVYAYYKMSLAYINLKDIDLATLYAEKMIPLLDEVEEHDMPYLLSNIGFVYKKTQPQKAKEYLERSLEYETFARTLENLADIYYEEGNREEAYHLWEKALMLDDDTPKDNIIYNMLQYDVEHQDKEAVCEKIYRLTLIKDSMANALKDKTIAELQQKFDEELTMSKIQKERMWWIISLLLLTLVIIVITVIYKYRQNKTTNKLIQHQMLINDYMNEIAKLQAAEEMARQQTKGLEEKLNGDYQYIHRLELEELKRKSQIEELNKKINDLMNKESPRLMRGKYLYDQLERGGSAASWNNDDIRCFNDYYKAVSMSNFLKIEREYAPKTDHNTFFLILYEMGKTDIEVRGILNITQEGIRSTWNRIKQNRLHFRERK